MIPCLYSSCCSCWRRRSSNKHKAPSFQIGPGWKSDRIVLQVNTQSDFRFDDTLSKMATMTSFHAEKCCHLVSADAASAGWRLSTSNSSWSFVLVRHQRATFWQTSRLTENSRRLSVEWPSLLFYHAFLLFYLCVFVCILCTYFYLCHYGVINDDDNTTSAYCWLTYDNV